MADRVVKVSAIQQRHDTVENWEAKNPILLDGETITVIFADKSTRHKTGCDGKRYNDIPFDDAESCEPSNSVSVTLLASDWTSGQQTISVEGLTADQNGVAALPQVFSTAQYEAVVAAEIYVSGQTDGSLTFSCMGDTPQIDIPVIIILLG